MALDTMFSDFGGAVSDLFAAEADKTKAQGLRLEAQQYGLAQTLAQQNVQFTAQSTELQEYQAARKINATLGAQKADVAASGFESSGSALDLLADSARQGALATSAMQQQGLITEASYQEQAASYGVMQQAADLAATAADKAAQGAQLGAIIKGVAGVASVGLAPLTGGLSLLAPTAISALPGEAPATTG